MSALLAAALGTWLGIQALRMTLAMVIWNVAEDNTGYAGEVAVIIWTLGIAGSFLVRLLPVRRLDLWLGALFAILVVLRQAFPGENTSPAFAFAAWVAWMWWLPAILRRSARAEVATGIVLGVALQVAGQIALHGLDLELLQGLAPVVATVVLVVAFALALASVPAARPAEGGAWGAFAVGPYLFLELTLLANLGRLEMISGLGPVPVQLVSAAGFTVALASMAFGPPRIVTLVLALLAVAAAAVATTSVGAGVLVLLIVAQAGLALALLGAFTGGSWPFDARIHALGAAGMVVLFALVFVFYSYRDRGELLWPVAALIAVLPGVFAVPAMRRTWRPAIAAAAVIIVALLVGLVPPPSRPVPAIARDGLAVLTYNLHQGLDYWSVPSAEALAERIEGIDADLVALQEVNRGWDLSAGIDLFAYLRWRLPQYHAVYGRMDTDLFGNAILSRYPISESGVGILPHLNSALNRGYVWATVDAPGGLLLFVSTHFTAYEGFDEERIAQADAYAAFWAKRPRSILAGDYNSHPEDASITRLTAAGLVDAPAAVGLGKTFTYSSGAPHERIDYVFVSPDLVPQSASVLEGTASDHSPVLVTIRAR